MQVDVAVRTHPIAILQADALADNAFIIGENVFADGTHLASQTDDNQGAAVRINNGYIHVLRLCGTKCRCLEFDRDFAPQRQSGEPRLQLTPDVLMQLLDERLPANGSDRVGPVGFSHLPKHIRQADHLHRRPGALRRYDFVCFGGCVGCLVTVWHRACPIRAGLAEFAGTLRGALDRINERGTHAGMFQRGNRGYRRACRSRYHVAELGRVHSRFQHHRRRAQDGLGRKLIGDFAGASRP